MRNSQVAIILLSTIMTGSALANPAGGVVTAGEAVITQTPGHTVIQQSSQNAIVNWRSFNIGAGEKTHFEQPQGGVTLNRISATQGPSQIYGQLTATGKIILVNQAGIFFGPGSYVNVGGIIATTSNISDKNFLSGKIVFDQPSSFNASVINKGTIIAAQNGLVALLGNNVSNEGLIQAQQGSVVLASGKKFTVDLYGDQLVNFTVDEGITNTGTDETGTTMNDAVKNSGTIMADGGTILMTAKDAAGVVDHVINMSGVALARSVDQKNGVIILSSDAPVPVIVTGLLDASGLAAGQRGGVVKILGKKIFMTNNAKVDASGDQGGGEILIGGNYQGKSPELNALTTYIAPDVNIHADALTNGNGGKVIAWADEDTYVYGNITARGGSQGGNGGFLETSGHYLDIGNIKVNLSAANGVSGNWLLDPYNITISTGTQSSGFNGGSPINTFTPTANSIINTTTLQTNLNAANVIISTGLAGSAGSSAGNITISSPILSWSTTNYLHLQALGTIAINANVATGAAGSKIIFDAGGNITQSGIISGAGDIEKRGAGTATFSQANTYTGATIISGGTISIASLADVGNDSPLGTGAGGIIITGGNADGSVLGGILQYTGSTATVNRSITIGSTDYSSGSNGTLKFTGSGTLTWNGAVGHTVGTTDTFIIDTTNALNSGASGIISNASGVLNVIKKGAGTWGGLIAHSYSGTTTINAGAIAANTNFNKGINSVVGSASAVPNGTPSLIFNGGAITTANSVSSFGTNRDILLNSGGGTFGFTAYPTGAVITLSGVISGTGQLTKTGARGTVTLTGNNTYSGGTLVTSGMVAAGNNNAFGTNLITVNNSGIVQINTGINVSNAIVLNGIGFDGNGALRGAGSSTYSGVITLASASGIGAFTGATGFNVTNTIIGGGFGLTLAGEGIGSISSVINTTISSITKSGTGTWTLSGANTYTGTTTINSGGVLNISTNSAALGSGTVNVFGTLGLTGGTGLTIANNIILNNGSILADSGVGVINTITGNITLAGSGNATISSSLGLDINGTVNSTIAGASGLNLQGSGAINLNGVVGGSNALASITSDLATIVGLGASSITTTGSQTYNGAATVGIAGNVVLTSESGSVTFARAIELLANTQISAGGNISLDSIIGHFHTLDLVGSSGSNSFIFNNTIVDTTGFTVNGGSAGTDTLDFSNLAGARNFILSSIGSNHGFSGSDVSYAGLSFDNINSIAGNSSVSNTLTGNSGGSTWTLSSSNAGNYTSTNSLDFSNIGTLVGGGGTNTLIAANTANTWNITGSNTGTVTGLSGSFSAMQNLMGGSSGKNIFNFAAGATISGSVDGGNTTSINELNFADNVTIRLQSLTSGNVTNTNSAANIVSFSNTQQAQGQGSISNLYMPTGKTYTITYYDATKTNGEIGDPFYFFNMFVLNAPEPEPAPAPVVEAPVNVYNVVASVTQTTDAVQSDTTSEDQNDDVVTTAVSENVDQVIEDTAAKVDVQTESSHTFGCFSAQ